MLRVEQHGRAYRRKQCSGGYSQMSFSPILLYFAAVIVEQRTRRWVKGPLSKLFKQGQSHDLGVVGVKREWCAFLLPHMLHYTLLATPT